MKRTHDKFYLNENNKNVKESFVAVADVISRQKFSSIADVGCATGAFPHYLKKRFPSSHIEGIEYLDSLLNKAVKDFPNISFSKGNVLDKESVTKKFDVITMVGVLELFDDCHTVLKNVLSWLNPKGRLILKNLINEYDIDVFIKYRPSSDNYIETELESGWNIISKKSLELFTEQNNSRLVSCEDFSISVDLPKQRDVMRSWTENNLSGSKDIFNALHIRQPFKIVVIEKLPKI
tara:strand:+ start:323 stop:1027 length:705 start_codon:yes stop_codon:yes gene_type:complete